MYTGKKGIYNHHLTLVSNQSKQLLNILPHENISLNVLLQNQLSALQTVSLWTLVSQHST